MAEYGWIVLMIGIAMVVILTLMGNQIKNMFYNVGKADTLGSG